MYLKSPGKIVLSGAYSVLYGAPAIVSAVNRYVYASAHSEPTFVAEEVLAALDESSPLFSHGAEASAERQLLQQPAAIAPHVSPNPTSAAHLHPPLQYQVPATILPPFFDASELRSGDKKLGLGSSAAITAASLGALLTEYATNYSTQELIADPSPLVAAVYPIARWAHQRAQAGGSGIDIAAACFGGTWLARRVGAELQLTELRWPNEIHVEIWWSGEPATTSHFIRRVQALERSDKARFERLLFAQAEASEAAARALTAAPSVSTLMAALGAQAEALKALGDAAGIPIVPANLARLMQRADPSQEVWLPAGAGGGDVNLRFWLRSHSPPPAPDFNLGWQRLNLTLGAEGLSFAAARSI